MFSLDCVFKALFRRKSLANIMADTQNHPHQLQRTLTAFDLIVFGVSGMIGAGIFVLTGAAAAGSDGHLAAGPALTVSFLITGIICSFCALCYSEFAAMTPVAGSAYAYAFSAMGEFVAWVIGWALVLEYAVGNMAVAVGWTGSVKEFLHNMLHIDLPAWFTSNTFETVTSLKNLPDPSIVLQTVPFTIPFTDHQLYLLLQKAFNIPAALAVVAVTALLYIGISESARSAAVMVFIKTGVVLLFVTVASYFLFGSGHWDVLQTNWFSNGWQSFAPNGWQGIITGASTIFFAYIGFDAVSTVAEETKNPQRDIPIGIIGSLAICTLLYIAVSGLITAIVPLDQINKEAAVVGAMKFMGYPWASAVVGIGAIAGLTSVLLVLQLGGVRVLYAIARDGLLPPVLAKVHPTFKTPHMCTLITGVFVMLGAGMLPINLLAEMCNIGTLGAFVVVCAGVAILQKTDPHHPRPFRVPFGMLFPAIGFVGCLFVLSGLPAFTWFITGIWFLLGAAIYFGYGIHHSTLNRSEAVKAASAMPPSSAAAALTNNMLETEQVAAVAEPVQII